MSFPVVFHSDRSRKDPTACNWDRPLWSKESHVCYGLSNCPNRQNNLALITCYKCAQFGQTSMMGLPGSTIEHLFFNSHLSQLLNIINSHLIVF